MKPISSTLFGPILVALLSCSGSIALAQRGSAGYLVQVNAGDREVAERRYESALSHYRYALVWNPTGQDGHIGLGNVYLKTGKKQKALEQFAYVLSLNKHNAAAERGIHDARSEGQELAAFQELEAQVAHEPNNPDLHTTYAEELVERDRLSDATYQATLALQLDAKQWHAHCALGRIAFKLGHLDEARTHLQLSTQHDPSDDDALETIGELELQQSHPDKAAAAFRQLIRLVPEEAEGHLHLADALAALGDPSGAANERRIAAAIRSRVDSIGK